MLNLVGLFGSNCGDWLSFNRMASSLRRWDLNHGDAASAFMKLSAADGLAEDRAPMVNTVWTRVSGGWAGTTILSAFFTAGIPSGLADVLIYLKADHFKIIDHGFLQGV